jgi:hypothetical protein
MSFREISLWFFGLFLLVDLFGRLKYLICETLESVVVLGLMLSMGVEYTNAI